MTGNDNNTRGNDLDRAIREAMHREMEDISPPPADKVWEAIAGQLDEPGEKETSPDGRSGRKWGRGGQFYKYAAVAAAFLIVFGLVSLLPRLGMDEHVPRMGSPVDEVPEMAPEIMEEPLEEDRAPVEEDSVLEEEAPDDYTAESLPHRDIREEFTLLPWVDTPADFELLTMPEAERLIPFSLPQPPSLPEEFTLQGIYWQQEEKRVFLAYSDTAEEDPAEHWLVVGREDVPAGQADIFLQRFRESGEESSPHYLNDSEATLLQFDDQRVGLAWESEGFLHTIMGNIPAAAVMEIAEALMKQEHNS